MCSPTKTCLVSFLLFGSHFFEGEVLRSTSVAAAKYPSNTNSVLGTCLLGGDRPFVRRLRGEFWWKSPDIKPEKEPFQKESSSSNPWILRGYISFSGGYCISLAMKSKDASKKKSLSLQTTLKLLHKWRAHWRMTTMFFVKELFEYLLSSQHPRSCQKQTKTDLATKNQKLSLAFPTKIHWEMGATQYVWPSVYDMAMSVSARGMDFYSVPLCSPFPSFTYTVKTLRDCETPRSHSTPTMDMENFETLLLDRPLITFQESIYVLLLKGGI